MKKSEWSDKELVELLRRMPEIKDYRHPHDIYRNLPIKKRKIAAWIVPGIAAAAALFLFFLLVPKFMNSNQYSMDQSSDEKSTVSQKYDTAENQTMMKKSLPVQEKQSDLETRMMEPVKKIPAKSAIYDEDVGNGKVC
ncbi:hypothetical protein [Bacillus sp. JJ1764]|uniref:hypothetical protein n=1 Tax=Bacillus sp. JJ1764 TaxID=3122964 RepID=UPI00300082C1